MKAWRAFLLLTVLLAALAAPAAADVAQDITDACKLKASSNKTLFRLTDGKQKMAFEGLKKKQNYIEVTLPEGKAAGGLYIIWKDGASPVALENYNDKTGEYEKIGTVNRGDYVHEYTAVDHLTRFRFTSTDAAGTIDMIELTVLGVGDTLPDEVQNWQPPCRNADLLMVIAHPDDEYIFFGGAIPWYAVEKEMHVAVAWLTLQNETRLHELLNALWTGGVREYPYLLRFYDKLSEKTRVIYKYWDEQKALDALAGVIEDCRPNVVVTHDLDGEYGHGAHKACADLCLRVIRDGERDLAWDVKKLYLHLWQENPITIEWNREMKNGKTALAQAQQAFKCHKSQQGFDTKLRNGKIFKFQVKEHGMFDNSDFGLAYTTVGADRECNDFFEGVQKKEQAQE